MAWNIRLEFVLSITSAINAFRRTHMFEFIAAFITQPFVCNHFDELEKFVPIFVEKLTTVVNTACIGEESKTLNAQQLKDATKAAQSMARFCRKHFPAERLATYWNMNSLEESFGKLKDSERFNQSGVIAAWKTLLATLNLTANTRASKVAKPSQLEADEEKLTGDKPLKAGSKRKILSGEDDAVVIMTNEDHPSRKPKRKKIKHKKTTSVKS